MDVKHLNRLAKQVVDRVQQQAGVPCLQFSVWRRGIADPDAYLGTGRICQEDQRDHTFELSPNQLLDLLAQSEDQVVRALETLLTAQAQRVSR